MTYRNIELVKAFKHGETGGENHTGSMSIYAYERDDGVVDTLLVGYDNAIYAHRNGETEKVTKFLDWVYGSRTNKQHVESFSAEHTINAQPQITEEGHIKRDGVEVLKRIVKTNDGARNNH